MALVRPGEQAAALELPAPRRARQPLLVGAAGLLAAGYVAAVDPSQPGHYPLCPFRAMTGLDCPLCGGLRGTYDILHGHVVAGLDQNLLLAAALPLTVVAWVAWLARAWSGRPAPRLPAWALPTAVAVLVVFGVVRNLPGVPFLGSGPG